jgi:hypothetical protein
MQVNHNIPDGEIFLVDSSGQGAMEPILFSPAYQAPDSQCKIVVVDQTEERKARELVAKRLAEVLINNWEQSDE